MDSVSDTAAQKDINMLDSNKAIHVIASIKTISAPKLTSQNVLQMSVPVTKEASVEEKNQNMSSISKVININGINPLDVIKIATLVISAKIHN